jgi:hypothetical protein
VLYYSTTGNTTFSPNTGSFAMNGVSNTITLTSMKFAGASKTLSTAANSIDMITVFYDGTTYYANLVKGYA